MTPEEKSALDYLNEHSFLTNCTADTVLHNVEVYSIIKHMVYFCREQNKELQTKVNDLSNTVSRAQTNERELNGELNTLTQKYEKLKDTFLEVLGYVDRGQAEKNDWKKKAGLDELKTEK